MALKHQNEMLATFSMASMTDVIFLLLVFFMVTSTFVFPTALDINLPQGTEQTPSKPSTMVFIDSLGNVSAAYAEGERLPFDGAEARRISENIPCAGYHPDRRGHLRRCGRALRKDR